jgi:phosphonate transport system substrate-binding protein
MPIVIAAVAYDPRVVTVWEGMCDHLTSVGVPTDYVLYRSYEAQVEALFARKVDVAWNTNLAYVRSQARAGGRCRALAMRDTDLDWRSILIARPGALSSVEGLRDKTLALGSRDSGHAHILPVHFLRQLGLAAGRDYRPLRFDLDVGKHGDTGASEVAVLEAVLDGRAEAGVVGEPFWARALASGQVPRGGAEAVWTSPPFHHCMFTALPDFDVARGEELTSALFAMSYDDPRHRPILDAEGLKQWLPPRTDGYGSLVEAAGELGLL